MPGPQLHFVAITIKANNYVWRRSDRKRVEDPNKVTLTRFLPLSRRQIGITRDRNPHCEDSGCTHSQTGEPCMPVELRYTQPHPEQTAVAQPHSPSYRIRPDDATPRQAGDDVFMPPQRRGPQGPGEGGGGGGGGGAGDVGWGGCQRAVSAWLRGTSPTAAERAAAACEMLPRADSGSQKNTFDELLLPICSWTSSARRERYTPLAASSLMRNPCNVGMRIVAWWQHRSAAARHHVPALRSAGAPEMTVTALCAFCNIPWPFTEE